MTNQSCVAPFEYNILPAGYRLDTDIVTHWLLLPILHTQLLPLPILYTRCIDMEVSPKARAWPRPPRCPLLPVVARNMYVHHCFTTTSNTKWVSVVLPCAVLRGRLSNSALRLFNIQYLPWCDGASKSLCAYKHRLSNPTQSKLGRH